MKKIGLLLLVCIFSLCAFVGCGGNVEDETPIELKNGDYKVTACTVNGQTEETFVGDYATINESEMISWEGLSFKIEIDKSLITFTLNDVTIFSMSGTLEDDVLTINYTLIDQEYSLTLKYEEKANFKDGTYQITKYNIDGESQDISMASAFTISIGNMNFDWQFYNFELEIKGQTLFFSWTGMIELELRGEIKDNQIIIDSTFNDSHYEIILEFIG